MIEALKQLLGLGSDAAAEASRPAHVAANSWRVAGSYPLWPALLALAWVVALAAVIDGFHWGAFVLLAGVTYANYLYWSSTRSWFLTGDACPAAIISVEPLLVATLTDLSATGEPAPAVKVRREPAKRFAGEELKVGKPVICVSRYDGAPGAAVWSNFHPRPVQCATANDAEVKRLIKETTKDQWQALQAAIRRLPKPVRPGLYRLSDDP